MTSAPSSGGGSPRVARALARLFALAPRGARHGLDAMREACAREGDPQSSLTVVHVAGTNGKGSVCAYVDAIARAAGVRTGLYTSPHLLSFSERIQIDGRPIDDERLAVALEHVLDAHPQLTFFEVATLAAFLVFRDAKLDVVVLEVGLGGRLDATNVVQRPRATAITTIGLDHTAILGDTIEKIAREKAGILKQGVPCVVGDVSESARAEIAARAAEVGSPLMELGKDVGVESIGERGVKGARVRVKGRSIVVRPTLAGEHQLHNAAIAVAIACEMNVEERAIVEGVAAARWPGRLEEIVVDEGPLAGRWLLDGAHNVEGVEALAAFLESRHELPASIALVFGAMADKPWREMIARLSARCAHRIYVEPMASGGGRPAARASELQTNDVGSLVAVDAADALRRAREIIGKTGLVVVAGSLYLVGEARALLLDLPRDPQVGL